jgi:hypothetical protein
MKIKQSSMISNLANGITNIYVGTDLALKSVDIDDGLFKEELESLRIAYWTLLESISEDYDYGIVHFSCKSFRDKAVKHIKTLIGQMEDHQR